MHAASVPARREKASVSGVEPHEHPEQVDLVIVGGGLGGSLLASVCGRVGYSSILIDRHEVYPPDFRAEHLDGQMIEQFHRLGFLSDLTKGLARVETVSIARNGRIVAETRSPNFGLRYEDLVGRARATLPNLARRMTGKAVRIVTGEQTQTVTLADGRNVTGRLVVLATGPGQALAAQLGIGRAVVSSAHSLTFGFDLEPAGNRSFPTGYVVYQREGLRERIDYLAAFTLGRTTRANLFTYRNSREQWTRDFIADPTAGLRAALPGLECAIGPYRASGPVRARPMDVYVAHEYHKDGVVLIGDAFQGCCPATGMGVVRLLTDIERLATVYLPVWMRTPGMSAAKLASFYEDPVKRACDAKALHDAGYRRAVSTEPGLGWRVHRARVAAQERARTWLFRAGGPAASHAGAMPGTDSLAAG